MPRVLLSASPMAGACGAGKFVVMLPSGTTIESGSTLTVGVTGNTPILTGSFA